MRTYDAVGLVAAAAPYRRKMHDFSADDIMSDEDNYVFRNEGGDYALFIHQRQGVYCGHYLFQSRGRNAIREGKAFLEEAFSTGEVEVIEGLTPLENLGARWMNKKLGFKSYGVTPTKVGPCEIVILTKTEWEAQ